MDNPTQTCCAWTDHLQLPRKWQTALGGTEKWNSTEKAKSRDRGGSSSLFAQFDLNYVLTLSSQEWIWGKISSHRALASCIALLQKSCTTSISLNGQLLPTTYVQFLPLIWSSSLKIKLNINIDIYTTVSRQEGVFSWGRGLNAQNNFDILSYPLKNSSTPTAWLRHLKTQLIFQSIPSLSLEGKQGKTVPCYISTIPVRQINNSWFFQRPGCTTTSFFPTVHRTLN